MPFIQVEKNFFVLSPEGLAEQEQKEKLKELPSVVENLETENATLIYENMMSQMQHDENVAELWYIMAMGGA